MDKLDKFNFLLPSEGFRGFRSEPVSIGSVLLGGDYPVRIQSMTNTDTLDTAASVAQCIRIIEAGADFVRLTAQGVKEAKNLAAIKKELRKAGFDTPLIADIHFNPSAAETAARLVEKVRINPGNYTDRKASSKITEVSESEYSEELERIRERLLPLIKICRQYGTVIRIGVNHGSLSDRILSCYGNTPKGMVISALEFIEIFRGEGFNNLVISLKSSEPDVMVQSNILLAKIMAEKRMGHPMHLGVTEAGEGEDGRIISATGIGTLLSAGIGDTIRISLSEEPENEIPVAKEIIYFSSGPSGRSAGHPDSLVFRLQKDLYKPVVITDNDDGTYKTEQNKIYTGSFISFDADNPQSLSGNTEDRIILNPVFHEDDFSRLTLHAATVLGKYFITRQADGICISNKGRIKGKKLGDLSFSILQGTGVRITRNRYISCPTCGRTRFNLQEAVKKVKTATSNFSGLKIAVMGCIVNGPGEMAGADYGYVGAGPGKVHIYRGSALLLKNVPEEKAVEELTRLITEDLDKKKL